MVMIWPWLWVLRWSSMAAIEEVLPAPVPPTTITSPFLLITTSFRTPGRPNWSMLGISVSSTRITSPQAPCWMKALQRKRPMPSGATAKLHSLVASYSFNCLSFITAYTSASVCSAVSLVPETGRI